jgi:predicted DNA-binding antitoxin AbrB/MazE fold protein
MKYQQKNIEAIYESGVFKPLNTIDLYNGQYVKIILEYDEHQKPDNIRHPLKEERTPLEIKGLSLSDEIIKDRLESD